MPLPSVPVRSQSTPSRRLPCDSLSNADLLQRFGDGDPAAWNAIVDRFERLVHSVPSRSGLGPHDAADVTQATFAALINQFGAIREPDRLGFWLTTVARRLTWRLLEQRRREAPVGELIEGLSDLDGSRASDHAERIALDAEVYDAMNRLPASCREVITQLFFDRGEPSYAEISLRLDRPLGSIGPTRQRCLDRLRETIEEMRR